MFTLKWRKIGHKKKLHALLPLGIYNIVSRQHVDYFHNINLYNGSFLDISICMLLGKRVGNGQGNRTLRVN